MGTFYKATRLDGMDRLTGTVDYGAALETGETISLPEVDNPRLFSGDVMHAAANPAGLSTLHGEDIRLFEVEGEPVVGQGEDGMVGLFSLRVTRELDPLTTIPDPDALDALPEPARWFWTRLSEEFGGDTEDFRRVVRILTGGLPRSDGLGNPNVGHPNLDRIDADQWFKELHDVWAIEQAV